jgi:hypothetical protein
MATPLSEKCEMTSSPFTTSQAEARRILVAAGMIGLLAVAIRLAFINLHGPEIGSDSNDYFRIAQNLVQHGSFSLDVTPPFSPSIRWPPLYPFFLASLDWIGALSPNIVATIQAILDSVTVMILVFIASRLLPLKWAFAVGLIYAIHPGALSSANAILTETLFTALLVCAIWILCLSLISNKLRLTALSGFVFGFAILCRPVILMLPLVLFVLMAIMLPLRRSFIHGIVLMITAAVVITPWAIRSSRVAGRLVVVQDPVGFALLFYAASRWDWDQKDQTTLWVRCAEERQRLEAEEIASTGHLESKPDRLLFKAALNNVRRDPGKYLASRIRNVPYLFLTSYDSASGINQSFATVIKNRDIWRLFIKAALLAIFSLLPFAFGVIGLIASRKVITATVCATVWLYTLVFCFPIWLEPRFWAPCIPFLLVSAALGARTIATWPGKIATLSDRKNRYPPKQVTE